MYANEKCRAQKKKRKRAAHALLRTKLDDLSA
jgi:hypothetical protein